jgi:dolichyl-phosphate-mannose-protein mannosyltransferase
MKWYQRLFRYPELWVLTVAALATRLWQLGLPPAVVFDEVYFRQFAANYLTGNYFFDIHPPLVKLLFGGIAYVLHLVPQQIVNGDPGTTVLRILPAIAGALLVPLVYVILRQLRLGRRIAAFGAVLVLLDNALLVESRFILMDSILLLAGMAALSALLKLRTQTGRWRWLWVVLTAVCLGMLVSTKWTGLATAALVAIGWFVDVVRKRPNWPQVAGEAATAIFIVALIYIGSFMIHFTILSHSGDGDPFMSKEFQSTLQGNPNYKSTAHMSLWSKFIELNKEMYTAQSTLVGVQHPYASKWFTWPLEVRPVYYWQGETLKSGTQGNIYMLGNPVVWLMAFVGTLAALLFWLIRPEWLGSYRRKLVAFLLLGYGLNFVPFAFIDRPMFLYHYLFALLFSIMLACVMLGAAFDWLALHYGRKAVVQTYWILIATVVLSFLYFLPISYGWPLSPADLQQRMWLPTWR